MAQLFQKGGLCNMKMFFVAVIFCLLSPVAANVLVSSEHKPLMPVKDHPVLNNPGAIKETQMIVEKVIPYLQAYKLKALYGDNVFKDNLQAPAPKAQKIKPRVNILTDPSYSEPLVKVNLILGLFFYGFIVIVFLYDAVRISMEARRRSDAMAAARLKKRQPATAEPQTLASRVRESISSRFGLKQASSTPQCASISDDSAKALHKSKESVSNKDKSKSEKRPGKNAVRLRECEPSSIHENFIVPDSEPAIQVVSDPFDTELVEVVIDNPEPSNCEATENPCYTQSGLTEVCID